MQDTPLNPDDVHRCRETVDGYSVDPEVLADDFTIRLEQMNAESRRIGRALGRLNMPEHRTRQKAAAQLMQLSGEYILARYEPDGWGGPADAAASVINDGDLKAYRDAAEEMPDGDNIDARWVALSDLQLDVVRRAFRYAARTRSAWPPAPTGSFAIVISGGRV